MTARYGGKGATMQQIQSGIKGILRQFPVFKSINVKADGDRWDYVYVASPPVDKSGPPRSAKSFTLAPGGLRAQEERVLSATDPDKKVHLMARHVDIAEADLPKRLEQQKLRVIEVRDRKIEIARERMRPRQKELADLTAAPEPANAGKAAKRLEKIASRQRLIAEDEALVAKLEGMDLEDREVVKKFMEGEKPMYTVAATKFTNEGLLERAIQKAVTENAAKIERDFMGTDGNPKAAGARTTISATTLDELGIGYELTARNEIVKIAAPLRSLTAVIVLVDPDQGHFVVETAYPER